MAPVVHQPAQNTTTNTQQAKARIRRLIDAIGVGPHSADVHVADQVRVVLEMIGDQTALRILGRMERRMGGS